MLAEERRLGNDAGVSSPLSSPALRPFRATVMAWGLALAARALLGCSEARGQSEPGASATSEVAAAPEAPRPSAAGPTSAAVSAAAASAPEGTLLLSAVGDCTLGDAAGSERAPGSFHHTHEATGRDMARPFSGVLGVLGKDDLTIANLETTLTTAPQRTNVPFAFRGKPEFAQMLVAGSIDVVNLANNHTADCGFNGTRETAEALERAGVGHFGLGAVDRRTIRGIEVVNLGWTGGRDEIMPQVVEAIRKEKRPDNLVIVSFHWGIEGEHASNGVQLKLGRASIDAGADLVLGHHPHVLQGIEEYKGRRIVYSLGNFVFGGNAQPSETESMIFQARFEKKDGVVRATGYEVIPVFITGDRVQNDFRPVLASGPEAERIKTDVGRWSEALTKAR